MKAGRLVFLRKFSKDCNSFIVRPPIHNQLLVIGIGLLPNAQHGFTNERTLIERRGDDRDCWQHTHAGGRSASFLVMESDSADISQSGNERSKRSVSTSPRTSANNSNAV